MDVRTKRPFILAQVALKAYAVVFALVLGLALLAVSDSSSGVALDSQVVVTVALLIAIVVGLLCVAKGLDKGKPWAQVLAFIVFIGLAVVTVPILRMAIKDEDLPEIIWSQLWIVILLCLGVFSLIVQRPQKTRDTESVDAGECPARDGRN